MLCPVYRIDLIFSRYKATCFSLRIFLFLLDSLLVTSSDYKLEQFLNQLVLAIKLDLFILFFKLIIVICCNSLTNAVILRRYIFVLSKQVN